MSYISIYPLSTSTSEPPPLPGALTTSIASRGSITPLSVPQTASQLNLRDEMWKDYMIKDRDFSDPSQERRPSAQRCRSDAAHKTVQEQGLTATRNSPNSNDSDNFPDIDALLSGIKQKDRSASANPNYDDDDDNGFLDIDKLLAGLQQETTSASAKPDLGGMAGKWESTQDPIILSDDESVGPEPNTDFSSLDIDLTAKRDSHSPHIADDLADGNGFGFRTTVVSDRLVADHQDDGDDTNNDGVVDVAKPRLAAGRPRSASPSYGSVTHQASKLRVNAEITHGSANHVDVDVTKEVGDKSADVFAKGDDDVNNDDNACSTRISCSSTASCNNPASTSNVSVSELQAG